MDTKKAIEKRRAVKHFDPEYKMTEEETKEIFSTAMLSPTAFNIQHWRFVMVSDIELRKKVREVAFGQAQITDSSMLVIICADLKAWDKNPERYYANAPDEVKNMMLPMINQFYNGQEQLQRDEAMRSCGIAAQTLMLTATSMGYESCPMSGFDFNKVGELINLPDDHLIAMIVVIGKGTEAAHPKPGELSMDEVVINNKF